MYLLTFCYLLVISTVVWSLPWSSRDDKYWSSDKSVQSYFNPASFPKAVTFDHSIFDDNNVKNKNDALNDADDIVDADADDHHHHLIKNYGAANADVEDTVDAVVDSKVVKIPLIPKLKAANVDNDHDNDDIIEPVIHSVEHDVAFDVDTEIWKSDENAELKQQHSADTGANKCDKCPPGYGFIRTCNSTHGTLCEPCEYRRSFSDHVPHFKPCSPCSKCGTGMFEDYPCTPQTDTFCDSCAERNRWPTTDDIWQNDDFVEKCGGGSGRFDAAAADEFAASSREDSASTEEQRPDATSLLNRIAKVPRSNVLEKSPEISSEEKEKKNSIGDDNDDDMIEPELEPESKTGLAAKQEEQEQFDRLYKSVGDELKELEAEDERREKELSKQNEELSASFENGGRFRLKKLDGVKHSDFDDGPEIFDVKKFDADVAPVSSDADKIDSNDNNGALTGMVQESIAIVETKYAVDEQSSTITASPVEALPGATTRIAQYPAINPDNVKINKEIVYKPSAHNYPYNELIHAQDEFRMKQIKKAVMLYSITAVVAMICFVLFVFYTKMLCSRRRLLTKMPSNLTDQDDRIITECARIMAEKEAPKKRPSLFESSQNQDGSLNVLENPLVEYLEEDYGPQSCREQVHNASTESLIPTTEKYQQKRAKNNAVIV